MKLTITISRDDNSLFNVFEKLVDKYGEENVVVFARSSTIEAHWRILPYVNVHKDGRELGYEGNAAIEKLKGFASEKMSALV